jgi:asparagine synthase (glutamine-hydrolysing)
MIEHRIFFGVVSLNCLSHLRQRLLRAIGSVYGQNQIIIHESECMLACSQHWKKEEKVAASGIAIKSGEMLHSAEWEKVAIHPELFEGTFVTIKVDPVTKHAVLTRDPFGIHSLYYMIDDKSLWFADDIRLLLAVKPSLSVNTISLIEWMHLGLPLSPQTFFEKIYSLGPGSILRFMIDSCDLSCSRYFKPTDIIDKNKYKYLSRLSPEEVLTKLEVSLENSISRRAGNRKTTVLLSGGVDSSLVTAFARVHTDVTALTIDLSGRNVESEVKYARIVAKKLNVSLHEFLFDEISFNESLCRTIYNLGTPIIVENAVALSAAAMKGIFPNQSLILDGEGSDALFYGSVSLFKYSLRTYMIQKMTGIPWKTIRSQLGILRKFLHILGLANSSCVDEAGLDVMLGGGKIKLTEINKEISRAYNHLSGPEKEIAIICTRELYDYLLPMMLRLDRMAALANLDIMMPFCDREYAAFALNLPLHYRIKHRYFNLKPESKYLLKKLAEKYIPKEAIYRKKGGFHIPGGEWTGPFPDAWLKNSWISDKFHVNSQDLRAWLKAHVTSRDRMYLSSIEIWGRLFDWKEPLENVENEWMTAYAHSSRS